MGTRATLRGHYIDEEGEPISGAQVYIYQQHSTSALITAAPVSATIYTHDDDHPTSSAATTTLPLTTATDGSWGLFTANALRVDIKIVKEGKEDYWLYAQDIIRISGGVSDHGALTGLADDDHPQYVKDSEFDAAGDLLKGTGSDTFARLPRGSALQVLRTNSGAADIEWATPAIGDLIGFDYARPSVDQLWTSDTTFATVTGLEASVGANEIWHLHFNVRYRASAAGDIKVRVNLSTGTGPFMGYATGISLAGTIQFLTLDTDTVATFGGSGVGVNESLVVEGLFVNDATPKTVRLQAAQNTSDAGATTVKNESHMIARRVA